MKICGGEGGSRARTGFLDDVSISQRHEDYGHDILFGCQSEVTIRGGFIVQLWLDMLPFAASRQSWCSLSLRVWRLVSSYLDCFWTEPRVRTMMIGVLGEE
jgi:hypothetical protein